MTKKIFIRPLIKAAGILLLSSVIFISCATNPKQEIPPESTKEPVTISRNILGKGQLTPAQLTYYFMQQRPDADVNEILNFAIDYVLEAKAEGINSDVAFAQMCLETGYLRFGGLVQPEFHNYCGLGAMDIDHPGEVFATRTLGIRAHIQHLQAYCTTEDVKLNKELIDPRYNWVHKTKYIEDIWGLAGTWATDKQYAEKIDAILTRMENLQV